MKELHISLLPFVIVLYCYAKIKIEAKFSPNNAEARKWALWKVEGNNAKPSQGKFKSNNSALCKLKPTGDNRVFKVKIGVDVNKNKSLYHARVKTQLLILRRNHNTVRND